MKRYILFLIMICFLIQQPLSAQETKIYEATWESLKSRPYPQWFKDAKLGIFIHWGVSSVPSYGGKESYGEWFLRGLQLGDSLRTGFQKRVYGENFTYYDYAPLFKAELFNPDEWADLFKRSGAGYIIFVTKHHDGYCLWPSKYARNWNSMDVGPKRDLVGDLTKSIRKAGLKMGMYYSLPEWNHPLHRWYTDPHDSIGTYVETYMIPQFKELVSTYKPSLLFADGEWFNSAKQWHSAELISWYYNLVGDDAIVNNRWGGGSSEIGFLTPEYSSGIKASDRPWSEVRGLGRSFGLNRNEKYEAYMSPEELIHFFAKAVSNGGGITINVGPQADGQIPLLQQERLLQLGEWIKTNNEAIYGSESWTKSGEFKEYTVTRTDPQINFNWVRNTPGRPIVEDHFKVNWTGFIEVPRKDTYHFTAMADDGMRLWIDDKLVINKWEDSEEGAEGNVMSSKQAAAKDGKIKLKAGKKYPVRIEFYEKTHQAVARLFWESKHLKKQVVPQSALFTSKDQAEGDGLTGVYKSMGQYVGYTKNNNNVYAITLEWPDKELQLEIDKPAAGSKISLVGRAGNLPWRYENGMLFIDVRPVTYNQMPCQHAWTFRIEGLGLN